MNQSMGVNPVAQKMNPGEWLNWGIGAVVFVLVMAAILPDALDDWFNVSTGDWPSSVQSIWDLVVILVLIALAYLAWGSIEDRLG